MPAVITYATKTVDKILDADTHLAEGTPDTAQGTSPQMLLNNSGAIRKRIMLKIALPSAPADAATDRPNQGITLVVVRVEHGTGPAGSRTLTAVTATRGFDEETETWNSYSTNKNGKKLGTHTLSDAGSDIHSFTMNGIFNVLALGWGDEVSVFITTDSASATDDSFQTREQVNESLIAPTVRVTYEVKELTPITDLRVQVDPEDTAKTKRLLTWTQNKDSDFSVYRVFRKDGGGSWTQVGSDITQQGQESYVDAVAITELLNTQYDVRIVRSSAATIVSSNIVWMTLPQVTSNSISPASPLTVNTKTTATVTGNAGSGFPITLTVVRHVWDWGEGQAEVVTDSDAAAETRDHVYANVNAGYTAKFYVENNLGFRSLVSDRPVVVNSIAPVGRIKALPLRAETSQTIRLYASESYHPAGNKDLAAASAYEWDLDNNGTWEVITSVPETSTSFGGAGSKIMNLRVKDVDGTYSTTVSVTAVVSAAVTVNLDTLVEGLEGLMIQHERQVYIGEGVETSVVSTGGKLVQFIDINGEAVTDADVDNVPDDIETFKDVFDNNKPVQITIENVVRTGRLQSYKATITGGEGWIYRWQARVVLDP